MYLKEIFDVITPENIKNIPLLREAMEIFVKNLEENSYISADIKKIYQTEFKESDSESIQKSKLALREALLDTYLTALFNTLKNAQSDKVIKSKLQASKGEEDNYPFLHDVNQILNDEYFYTNKSVKESKGTSVGVEYAYNLTKYLESAENLRDFNLYEEKPFHFRADGSIYREMYENIVKPLSHPIGFTYNYNQIIKESISDLFGIEYVYDVDAVEVRGITGLIDVFTPASNDYLVKADFLTRENRLTGRNYTEEEYNELITVWLNKTVEEYTESNEDGRNFRSILFTDGTYLEQYSNPIEIKYQEYEDFLLENDELIKDYDGHYSLFVDYKTTVNFDYSDNIDQFLTTFDITKVKENNQGNAGDQFYSLSSIENSFHVGGDEYYYAPGLDETDGVYDDIAPINDEIDSKFVTTISGSLDSSIQDSIVTIEIEDEFGSKVTEDKIVPVGGEYSADLNTYFLQGDYYTVKTTATYQKVDNTHSHKTMGLNKFNRYFAFTNVEDNNSQSSNTLLIEGTGPVSTTLYITLTDKNGVENSTTTPIDVNGDWSVTIAYAGMEEGDFRIDAVIYKANGKIDINEYYEGSDLRVYQSDLLVRSSLIEYTSGNPDFSALLDNTEVVEVADIPGTDSTSPYIIHTIGELAEDDTFAPADQSIEDYLSENVIELIQLPTNLILNGSYIEGNNYDESNADFLDTEITFINFDRQLFPIDTSDYIVMTSTNDVQEDFLIYGFSTTGYYLFTDEIDDIDLYLYTNDEFYLTTLGDE
jgi:hypothetical protein